jgi:hypothetical protein
VVLPDDIAASWSRMGCAVRGTRPVSAGRAAGVVAGRATLGRSAAVAGTGAAVEPVAAVGRAAAAGSAEAARCDAAVISGGAAKACTMSNPVGVAGNRPKTNIA